MADVLILPTHRMYETTVALEALGRDTWVEGNRLYAREHDAIALRRSWREARKRVLGDDLPPSAA